MYTKYFFKYRELLQAKYFVVVYNFNLLKMNNTIKNTIPTEEGFKKTLSEKLYFLLVYN